MTKKLGFSTEKRKVKDLIDYEYNPRVLTQKAYADLKKSFEEFGYVEICVINKDNTILAGHQRVRVMRDLGWDDHEIEVRVPNKPLSEKKFQEYLVRSNKNTGDWDFDILANSFEQDDLYEWGFTESDFEMNDWESDLDESVKEDKEDSLKDTIKISCEQGHRDSIVEIVTEALKDLDVKIS